jgi:hypothetical protein
MPGLNGVGATVTNRIGVDDSFMGDGATAFDANYAGNTTSGSKQITGITPAIGVGAGKVNLWVGMEIRGSGIPISAAGVWPIVTAVNASTNTITISKAATATATAVALSGDPTEGDYNKTTTVPLWPWPYETVIKQFMQAYSYTGPTFNASGLATGQSASLSGDRGFASSTAKMLCDPTRNITLTSYLFEAMGNRCPRHACSYCPP